MQALAFYLALPFIYAISLLPFGVLYAISSGLCWFLRSVLGYRKKVVYQNLQRSFPEKSTEEIEQIARGFYQYFCDILVESVKLLTLSEKAGNQRFTCSGEAVFRDLAAQNKSALVVMGHFGNWEFISFNYPVRPDLPPMYGLYHPLSNKYFDRLIGRSRSRFGLRLLPMQTAYKSIVQNRSEIANYLFIADQAPRPKKAHWMEFLHQDTPVFLGPERIAKKLNLPVVYARFERLQRGHYDLQAELLVPDPQSVAPNEIIERFMRQLEKDIRRSPATYLWSHRRWKHQREV